MNIKRILSSALLFISVLYFPWWLSVSISVVLCFIFNRYFEGLALAFLYDSLYRGPEAGLFNIVYEAFLLSIILFILIELSKTRIKFY